MANNPTLIAFAQQVGKDVRNLNQQQGDLTALQTTAKDSLVAAINELFGKPSGNVTQTDIDTAITQLRNDLLGGNVSAELDTLRELGEKLQTLEQDDSIKSAILAKFTEIRTELDGLIPANLADIYTQAKTNTTTGE